jgi:hypothetical protein
MNLLDLDEDAVIACVDLAGRTGARNMEFGFLNDDPPHKWYANARYRGARISVEDLAGPVEAADALARRLLSGAKCMHCRRRVVLSAAPAEGIVCRWRRMGPAVGARLRALARPDERPVAGDALDETGILQHLQRLLHRVDRHLMVLGQGGDGGQPGTGPEGAALDLGAQLPGDALVGRLSRT